MSDGFTEMFNAEGEILSEDRAKSLFERVGQEATEQIIEHLKRSFHEAVTFDFYFSLGIRTAFGAGVGTKGASEKCAARAAREKAGRAIG
jgi:hypothetical protein